MKERLLVTGGSGFIGSEVVRLAVARGFEICNLDFKPPKATIQIPHWRKIDIRDGKALERELSDFSPHRIIHLASDIDVSISSLAEFSTTIDGTRNILASAAALPELRRFVHTSTQFTVWPGVQPQDERFLEPYTTYGEAKAVSERLVWDADLNARWFILRPTIIWGPHHPSFAQQIFRHIRSGAYLHPTGTKPIVRAFGYVTNVADQMLGFATLDANATSNHVFYLGDETIDYDLWADAFSFGLRGRRARRIPIWLLRLLGWAGDGIKSVGLKTPIDSGRAFRMSTSSQIDLDATHALVGDPKISFEEGVALTLAWLNNTEYAQTALTNIVERP